MERNSIYSQQFLQSLDKLSVSIINKIQSNVKVKFALQKNIVIKYVTFCQ
ncbi:MAG: hypothetical protein RSB10_05790 [Clostridia bacterium]